MCCWPTAKEVMIRELTSSTGDREDPAPLPQCKQPFHERTKAMFHDKRRWYLSEVESPVALAEKLTRHTWTLCTGFYVRGFENYLFLNDATHEDGALEIGV